MSARHKVVWGGFVLLILSLFMAIVRGPMSLALVIGVSLLLVLFVSDALKHGLFAPFDVYQQVFGESCG
jgi:hypothetical protein